MSLATVTGEVYTVMSTGGTLDSIFGILSLLYNNSGDLNLQMASLVRAAGGAGAVFAANSTTLVSRFYKIYIYTVTVHATVTCVLTSGSKEWQPITACQKTLNRRSSPPTNICPSKAFGPFGNSSLSEAI
jgi:hypothetical protein